jgi:hypothetical protein
MQQAATMSQIAARGSRLVNEAACRGIREVYSITTVR